MELSKDKYKCSFCLKTFTNLNKLNKHYKLCINVPSFINKSPYKTHQTAFNNFLSVFRRDDMNFADIYAFFHDQMGEIASFLHNVFNLYGSLKFQLCIYCEFIKDDIDDYKSTRVYVCSQTFSLVHDDMINEFLTSAQDQVTNHIDTFIQKGSGWKLQKISNCEIRVGKYVPRTGGCIVNTLPKWLSKRRAILPNTSTIKCFHNAILGCLYHEKGGKRLNFYKKFHQCVNFQGLSNKVSLKDIAVFEQNNDLGVNVYTTDSTSQNIVPLRISKFKAKKYLNILLIEEHYWGIISFNRLLRAKSTWARHYCYNCLQGFKTSKALQKHLERCNNFPEQRVYLPKNDKLYFKEYNKMEKSPYIIYADFESLIMKQVPITSSNTYVLNKHIPCSYGFIVVDWQNQIVKKEFYRGENAGKMFLSSLAKTKLFIDNQLSASIKPLNMSKDDEIQFIQQVLCHICGKEFNKSDKVRDHDHLTGKFRGAAHSSCNTTMRLSKKVPVVFHNLKSYDGHIIIDSVDSSIFNTINVIPHSTEKYLAIILDDFVFIDSYAFLSSSLDNLAKSISKEEKLNYLTQMFSFDKAQLLLTKGALPYEYMNCWERFDETNIPSQSDFHSELTCSDIDDPTYERLKTIWKTFSCNNLGEFHDIYLKTDVLLLAAVFENFRKMSLKEFSLDPANFFSTPGLTWSAALKYTKASFDYLKDIDMLLMVESGIRGGVSSAMKRFAKANNPYCPNFNQSEEKTYLLYLDVNNLYGWALSNPLPVGDFKWVPSDKHESLIELIVKQNVAENRGYFLEVDLDYPSELHDDHNDFPLAPERLKVNTEDLSQYQLSLLEVLKEQARPLVKTTKLIPNLKAKEKYILYYKNLAFYLKNGLIITKVHKVLQFTEKAVFKPYIDLCTSKRKKSSNSFERDFWKLMVNSLYGKSIENKRSHCKVKVVMNQQQAQKNIRHPLYEQFIVLGENKAIIKLKNSSVVLDKPIFLGFTVLELAKLHMYDLHYNVFKAYYKDKISLIYTDTDSFIYHITTEDVYKDLKRFNNIMDFSDYPKEHFLHDETNKKVIGKLKDELNGKIFYEIIALKSKLYVIRSQDGEHKRAKGTQRCRVEKDLSWDMYYKCLKENFFFETIMRRIESKNHKIQGIEQTKLSLSAFDDKRFYCNNINSLAYGHYKIKN